MRTGFLALLLVAACSSGDAGLPGSDLSGFETARISINGAEFEVWLAKTAAHQQQGFMFATANQQGWLGVGVALAFAGLALMMVSSLPYLSAKSLRLPGGSAFPLLVALTLGIIVILMRPEPVLFALEVFSGTLAAEGIGVGDLIVIPPEALD